MSKLFLIYRRYFRAGEKAQHLRALAALSEVQSSISRKHKLDQYHLSWDLVLSPAVSEVKYIMLTYMK